MTRDEERVLCDGCTENILGELYDNDVWVVVRTWYIRERSLYNAYFHFKPVKWTADRSGMAGFWGFRVTSPHVLTRLQQHVQEEADEVIEW